MDKFPASVSTESRTPHETPNKRFKIDSIPETQRSVVDLTQDGEENDSSDDDIIITGFREVPQKNNAYRAAFKQSNDPVTDRIHADTLLRGPSRTDKKTPVWSSSFKAEPASTVPRASLEEESIATLGTKCNSAGLVPVIYQGKEYYTEDDVKKRKSALHDSLVRLRADIESDVMKSQGIVKSVQDLNLRKERLRRLGTSETDQTMNSILQSLSHYSHESRKTHKRLITSRSLLQTAREKYMRFENRAKPQILKLLKQRPAPLASQDQQRLHQTNAQQELMTLQHQNRHLFEQPRSTLEIKSRIQQLNMKLAELNLPLQFRIRLARFRDDLSRSLQSWMVGPNGHNEDEDEDAFNEEYQYEMFERELFSLQAAPGLETNIYNMAGNGTEENSNLKDLLASVKKVEEAKEGESQTPENMTVNLLPHQRLGLHWLELAEDDEKKRGGILADDMGLGKTVQMIALLLSHRAPKDAPVSTNLIVCPVALMNQWKAEIEMKVKETAGLSVFIYHSVKRQYSFEQLKRYDVVITSFTTLAMEYKKHIFGIIDDSTKNQFNDLAEINAQKEKIPSSYKSPFFSSDSKFYRAILDEVQWIKNKSTNASLAAASIESHYRWCLSGTPLQNRIDELFPYLRFLRIKPYNREQRFRFDILMPLQNRNQSYDNIDQDRAMNKVRVLLKAILFRREKTSLLNGKPILQLPGKSIKIEKLDITTNENEASFYYSMEKASADRVRDILNGPKAKGNYSSILTLLLRLRQAAIHSELVRIGERKQGIIYDDDGTVVQDPRKIISQMCNAAMGLSENVIKRINQMERNDDDNRFTCPICFDSPPDEDWSFFSCGHGVCIECIDSFFKERGTDAETSNTKTLSAKCSECRLTVKKDKIVSYEIFDRICNKKQSKEIVEMIKEKELKDKLKNQNDKELRPNHVPMSPKFEKALEIIKDILNRDPSDKIIVFSQFTSMFDLFIPILTSHDIEPLIYIGSMNANSRNETVKEFYRNENSRVLLISMKAGNVGLTLTCANHVILMDPFWNPYVEEQAQDRAYRIGQFKPVTVHRILVQDSVEDRIMELQEKKKELIEAALDEKGGNSVAALNKKEIGMLFGIRDFE